MSSDNNDLKITKKIMAGCIDHTNLRAEATTKDIIRLCHEAVQFDFVSVCINPLYVPLAFQRLSDTGVKVCTVIGFPLGATNTDTKVYETKLAVVQGAREIDMVIRVGDLKEEKIDSVTWDIADVVRNAREINKEVIVKVIIETCLLTDVEKVRACQLAEVAGANYVKTSTGFGGGGATLADVKMMRSTVKPETGVKASGGIRSAAQAVEFLQAGATRIGTSSGIQILQEIQE